MTTLQFIVFAIAIFVIGLSKGGLGAGLPASLVLPTLSLFIDPKEVVGMVLPFLIIADVFALRAYWGTWNLQIIRQTLPVAVIGILIGGLLLSAINASMLKVIIACFTLTVVAYRLFAKRLKSFTYQPRPWHGYLSGAASGIASTLANAGGPVYIPYLLLQSLEPVTFVGTMALFFAVVNWLKVPIFLQQGILDPQTIIQFAWAIPLLPLGVWLGRRIVDWFDQKTFENLVLVLLIVSVLLLLSTIG